MKQIFDSKERYATNIYLLKVNNRNTRKKVWNMSKINNKDTITPSNIFHTFFKSFYCWIWTSKSQLGTEENHGKLRMKINLILIIDKFANILNEDEKYQNTFWIFIFEKKSIDVWRGQNGGGKTMRCHKWKNKFGSEDWRKAMVNSFKGDVVIIWKPVNWFALQIYNWFLYDGNTNLRQP